MHRQSNIQLNQFFYAGIARLPCPATKRITPHITGSKKQSEESEERVALFAVRVHVFVRSHLEMDHYQIRTLVRFDSQGPHTAGNRLSLRPVLLGCTFDTVGE
jgi:hypothetical protein